MRDSQPAAGRSLWMKIGLLTSALVLLLDALPLGCCELKLLGTLEPHLTKLHTGSSSQLESLYDFFVVFFLGLAAAAVALGLFLLLLASVGVATGTKSYTTFGILSTLLVAGT